MTAVPDCEYQTTTNVHAAIEHASAFIPPLTSFESSHTAPCFSQYPAPFTHSVQHQRCRVAIAMSKAATQDGAGARASSEAGAYSVQAGKKYRADPCCNLCSANNAFDAAAVDVCVRMENVEDRFNQLLGGECG